MNNILSSDSVIEERFVAFIDILGFKDLVANIESEANENNLKVIKSILNFMDEETYSPNYESDLPIYTEKNGALIETELGDPRLTYVSDCIIISAEATLDGFKGLSRKIHKITADLAWDGIFCRGAISKGKLFHQERVIFGSSYVKAYSLEGKAIYPRVIVDPDIIDFFNLSDEDVPLGKAFYGKDKDGFYYQRYWTWQLFPPYCGDWQNYLLNVRQRIIENLERFDDVKSIRKKYIWLRDEYNSLITTWDSFGLIPEVKVIEII